MSPPIASFRPEFGSAFFQLSLDQPDVVLCSAGTLGDVKPFLSIGRELVARGYRVAFLTNACWCEAARAVGIGAIAIAPRDPSQNGRDDRRFFQDLVLPSFHASFAYLRKLAEQNCRPLVVNRTSMLGAAVAVERFGLPSLRIALQPCAIRSRDRPGWPLTQLAEGRLRWARRRLLVPAALAFCDRVSPYRKTLRTFRRDLGLHPDPDPRVQVERMLLMLCPRWFALPQADWPERLVCTGFPYAGPLAERASGFNEKTAPIVFTSGTGVIDGASSISHCRAVAAANDRPALILSQTLTPKSDEPGLKISSFVDLEKILPFCAAIVHHGGIGTTSEAIRAGVPQLIVADRFDQPDNGVRVAELALGGAILCEKPSAQLVGETLARVLTSAHVRTQLATAARLALNDDAIGCVVDHVTALSNGPAARARSRAVA